MSNTDERPEDHQKNQAGKPMGCQPSLEEIYRYMDGFMDASRQETVHAHLSRCSGCDDFYHFHAGLRNLVGQRCRTELPSNLSQRIFQAIADQRTDPLA